MSHQDEVEREMAQRAQQKAVDAVARHKAAVYVHATRPHRSFVAPGANANLNKLKLREKHWSAEDGKKYQVHELNVMDQSGAMVPAKDFYEYLRQQFCEICALIHALKDNMDDVDYANEEHSYEQTRFCFQFWDAFAELDKRNLQLHPGAAIHPWPLRLLFYEMQPPIDILLSQQARNFKREESLVRMVCARRLSIADPVKIIVGFLGGRVGVQATFLPRDELAPAMNDLVESYNDMIVYDDEHYQASIAPDLQSGVFKEDPPGGRPYFRWSVHREGETESDTESELDQTGAPYNDHTVDYTSSEDDSDAGDY